MNEKNQSPAPAPESVEVPEGLSRSDAEFWLRKRGELISALAAHGLTMVTTVNGVQLFRLGKIEAQAAIEAPAVEAPNLDAAFCGYGRVFQGEYRLAGMVSNPVMSDGMLHPLYTFPAELIEKWHAAHASKPPVQGKS